jgi:hypothetical protein
MMQFTFAKIITTTMEVYSTIFFWYMFAMSAWWFVFYKMQSRVFCFMPGVETYTDNYKFYDDMLISVVVLKFISLWYSITFDQSSLNIFMIDWETPKMYRTRRNMKPNMKQSVSPWRRLFICNEFQELMCYKTIEPEFILLLFLVIVEGFGVKYFSLMEAELTTTKTKSPENFVLNFFLIVVIVFGTAMVQIFIEYALQPLKPLPTVDFTDTCSVANISIIMFNEEMRGHYIHGKSPSGNTDVDCKQLRLNLEQEAAGNSTVRGIHPSYPDAQTFQIFMPKEIIESYKKNF